MFISSCSNIQMIEKKSASGDIENASTDFELPSKNANRNNKNIEIKATKKNETLRLGKNGGTLYVEDQQDSSNDENVDSYLESNNLDESNSARPSTDSTIRDSLKIGVALGPGLERAFHFTSFLKILEKKEIHVHVLTGVEMGAVIAALYACGQTVENIDWMVFKFIKENKKFEYFDHEFHKKIDQYFLSPLKDKKIEDCSLNFYLTLYDSNKNKNFIFNKGNVRELLLLNLRLVSNPVRFKSGEAYSGSVETETFNSSLLKKSGANFVIATDALISPMESQKGQNGNSNYFNKVQANIMKHKKTVDLFLKFPKNKTSDGSLSDIIQSQDDVKQFLVKEIDKFKKKVI